MNLSFDSSSDRIPPAMDPAKLPPYLRPPVRTVTLRRQADAERQPFNDSAAIQWHDYLEQYEDRDI